jgi:hypothetical protein
MNKLISLYLILILSAGIFSRCKKDKEGVPPVLPPMESLTIDFSDFSSINKSSEQKGENSTNWEFAANATVVWKLLITGTLAVPVASFKLAVDKDPVSLDATTWQWSYSASVTSVTYNVRLTGQTGDSDVIWKMYITKAGTGGFAEFLWFEGTSKLDGTGGQWIIYQSPSSQGAMLKIDWIKTGTSVGTIKYTYLINDIYFNNYIEYRKTSDSPYNAYYKISFSNVRGTFVADVEWNTETKNGRVKCIDYLGDVLWYGWNGNKINI